MTLLLCALAPGFIACAVIAMLIIRFYSRERKKLKGNLSIGRKPGFTDISNERFYNIECKCGNKFSVKVCESVVKCELCESYDKLSVVVDKFYDGLGK